MKKYILYIVGILLVTAAVLAQNDDKIVVNKSLLTPDQLAQAQINQKSQTVQTTAEKAGQWVGVGKEVGTAMNESLQAISKTTTEFAATDLGKKVMFLVIWKVAGNDIIHYSVGITLMLVGILVWVVYLTTNCFRAKYLVRIDPDKTKYYDREKFEDRAIAAALSTLIFVVYLIICCMITFIRN